MIKLKHMTKDDAIRIASKKQDELTDEDMCLMHSFIIDETIRYCQNNMKKKEFKKMIEHLREMGVLIEYAE